MKKKIIAYYRVSTTKQGVSGLGLAAQEQAVKQFVQSTNSSIVREFTEIESGKNNKRPKLLEALEMCELIGARLIIAKLDRLSRNLAFIACMQESGVPFTCCDMPDANETLVSFMAVMAQAERRAISVRTKEALKAAKARGQKLGNPNIRKAQLASYQNNALEKAREVIAEKSRKWNLKVKKVIDSFNTNGNLTLQEVADNLNASEIPTRKGCLWTPSAVRRVLNSK